MTFFLIIVLIVGATIAFIYLSDKNAGKDYGQVQREVAASMSGMYVKDMPDPLDELRRIEARIQAGIVGDHLTETAINDGTYSGQLFGHTGALTVSLNDTWEDDLTVSW